LTVATTPVVSTVPQLISQHSYSGLSRDRENLSC
jgi:hypothetical protein